MISLKSCAKSDADNKGVLQHDYKNLSGTEVVYYKKLNEFRLWNHCGAYNITKYGRLRGNMQYLEDKWNIQINPIFLS